MSPAYLDRAEALVRRTGARVTRPRVEVLAVLCATRRPITQREVARRVGGLGRVDGVTIYRVLEWLTAQSLAHRVVADNRVWRFNAASADHAHFRCERCGTVTCLARTIPLRSVAVPRGYRSEQIELTVRGLCSGCASVRGAPRRSPAAARHRQRRAHDATA